MNLLKTIALTAALICTAACGNCGQPEMVGAFGKSSRPTEQEKYLFESVVHSHGDLQQLKPLKVSRQVVSGTNYRYECRGNRHKRVEIIIFEPLPGQGEARILQIDGKEYAE